LGSAPVLKQEAHDPTRLVRVPGYPLDTMNKADGLDVLRSTPNEYAKLVILTRMTVSAKKGARSCRSNPMMRLTSLAPRLCASSSRGYVMLWRDKFILCQGLATMFFQNKLKLVDLATWDKGKIGMGKQRSVRYLTPRRRCPHCCHGNNCFQGASA
jgi:hypothetical protein